MSKILTFIEKATKADRSYKSFKYCFESIDVPTLIYDDKQGIVFSSDKNGETDKGLKTSKSLKEQAFRIAQQEEPLFKYFLDGSRRTYKIDDIAYSNVVYPIISGQIGVACCERSNKDSFKRLLFEHQLVLAMPTRANYLDDNHELFFNQRIKELNELSFLKKFGIQFSRLLVYQASILKEGEKYENRGIAKIQDEMIEAEKRLVHKLVQDKKLNPFSYLIKDGSLEYMKTGAVDSKELSKFKTNYKCVIGASKSFNPELCKDGNKKSIAQKIAELPLFHRTPAYKYTVERIPGVTFSVWYLRIREQHQTASPFDGVLKIEKILVSEQENEEGLDSDEIDRISCHIINERNPTCYGSDNRWANHLYPIFLTESFIKSQYLSDVYFLNLF
ncbi:hypothetical protein [Methylovulum psychrotolerans]|uniref:NurA domain-containing protein n=1 Tax=Methylovulum psychrotolerans TaxID=1704499 RepID=A0A1Z4BUV8_9GAMM|nr:hypothetical protein [Methylovulum psychrotolerans]ASF45048.1 hypothetical protein CEK71_02630 [Methylovulum psychrotolerans]